MAKLTNIGFLIPVSQLPPSKAGVKRAAFDKKIRFYSSGVGEFQVGGCDGQMGRAAGTDHKHNTPETRARRQGGHNNK